MSKKYFFVFVCMILIFFNSNCFATSLENNNIENYTNNILVTYQNMSNNANNLLGFNNNLKSNFDIYGITDQCLKLFNVFFYSVLGIIIFNILTKIVAIILNKITRKFRILKKRNNLNKAMNAIREEAFYRVS